VDERVSRYVTVDAGFVGWRVGEMLADGSVVVIANIVRRSDLPGSEAEDRARETAQRVAAGLNWIHEMAGAG
jgi:hypothetical protein